MEESNTLRMIRNLLAYWGTFLMVLLLYYEIDSRSSEYNILQKIIMILLPLLMSSHFWNYKTYDLLNKEAYTTQEEYSKTYLNFTRFFIGVLIFFDISMTYGIGFRLGFWA